MPLGIANQAFLGHEGGTNAHRVSVQARGANREQMESVSIGVH